MTIWANSRSLMPAACRSSRRASSADSTTTVERSTVPGAVEILR